jgi:tetratricopeptide (TPR) repeat protein
VEEFWSALTRPGGLERAWRIYDLERRRNPKLVLFPEGEMNAYGYQRLQRGHPTEAIQIFQMNAEAYPRSANAFDSLSDAYLAAGDRKEALAAAEKALKLLPGDKELPEEFRTVLREGLEKKIAGLR